MQLTSKEHYELMTSFERTFKGHRLDREEKSMWPRGAVYQDGGVNNLFKAFREGYSLHQAIARMEAA